MTLKDLAELYHRILPDILAKRGEFAAIGQGGDRAVLKMLTACICTPQSSALSAVRALEQLYQGDGILELDGETTARILGECGVRFKYGKTRSIFEARERFSGGGLAVWIADGIGREGERGFRDRLAREIRGLGMKEASHFLRNIGYGFETAILDRHILRNLAELCPPCGIPLTLPETLTAARYRETEQVMTRFAAAAGIPLIDLDFVLWYRVRGELAVL
jgi:N-glycosylase/DNA lyase